MKKNLVLLVISVFVTVPSIALASQRFTPFPFQPKPSLPYLDPLQLIPIPPPPEPGEPGVIERLFADNLIREFRERYEQEFGLLEATYVQPSAVQISHHQEEGGILYGRAPEEVEKMNEFGEYMYRRMIEFHLDLYLRQQPSVRPVFEAKERLTNLEVRPHKDVSTKAHYSLSGNFAQLRFEHEWLEFWITWNMGLPNAGPGSATETTYSLRREFPHGLVVEPHYKVGENSFVLISKMYLTEHLLSTLTITYDTRVENEPEVRENLLQAGLSWSH